MNSRFPSEKEVDILRERVAGLVADLRDDPKLHTRLKSDPVGLIKERLPDVASNLPPDGAQHFAQVLQKASDDWGLLRVNQSGQTGMLKGGFLCPACRPTVYAALLAGGLAAIIAGGVTGGAAVAAIVSAAVPIVVAATGISVAAATTAVQAALASMAGKSALDILNGLTESVCKAAGC